MRRTRPALPRLAAALATLALAGGVAACEKDEDLDSAQAQPIDLALDFYVNPDHAGLYVGLEQGYFERAGLDVTPRVPSDPSAPVKEVAAGRADLAISYEPEVMLAREQGLDVVAIAAVVDEPLTSLIHLPAAGIAKTADLRGKTVATAGIPYQSDYLSTILGEAGVSELGGAGGERRIQPAAGASRRASRRDPRRLPQRRGRGPRPARREPRRRSPSTSSASRPTTSSC